MNKEEKRVLRRKRYTIASNFTLTDELLDEVLNLHLVNNHGKEQIKNETGNMHRVDRWLELLPQLDRKQTLTALCDFLDDHHPWLADDLRTEIKSEKAGTTYRMEETIKRESDALIQRDFGNSRRLSEFDKKDIKKLVGTRMQVMKDIWVKQVHKVEQQLEDVTKAKIIYKTKELELISSINSFMRVNKNNVRGSFLKEERPSNDAMVDETSDDHAVILKLGASIRELMDISNQSFMELEQLREEKRKALEVINVKDEKAKLNVQLEQAMEKIEKEMKDLKNDISKRDTRLEALKEDLKKKESRAKEDDYSHNRELRNLKKHLNASHERVKELESTTERLRRDLSETRGELEKTKNKSELLEKSRRLGFMADAKKGEEPPKNGRRPLSRPMTYRWKLRSAKTKAP